MKPGDKVWVFNSIMQTIVPYTVDGFTSRMFYMYPNAARQWYDSLPKATKD